MQTEECKKEYELLLKSGDLTILLPKMTGIWEKDKERFCQHFQKNKEIIEDYFEYDIGVEDDDF